MSIVLQKSTHFSSLLYVYLHSNTYIESHISVKFPVHKINILVKKLLNEQILWRALTVFCLVFTSMKAGESPVNA